HIRISSPLTSDSAAYQFSKPAVGATGSPSSLRGDQDKLAADLRVRLRLLWPKAATASGGASPRDGLGAGPAAFRPQKPHGGWSRNTARPPASIPRGWEPVVSVSTRCARLRSTMRSGTGRPCTRYGSFPTSGDAGNTGGYLPLSADRAPGHCMHLQAGRSDHCERGLSPPSHPSPTESIHCGPGPEPATH